MHPSTPRNHALVLTSWLVVACIGLIAAGCGSQPRTNEATGNATSGSAGAPGGPSSSTAAGATTDVPRLGPLIPEAKTLTAARQVDASTCCGDTTKIVTVGPDSFWSAGTKTPALVEWGFDGTKRKEIPIPGVTGLAIYDGPLADGRTVWAHGLTSGNDPDPIVRIDLDRGDVTSQTVPGGVSAFERRGDKVWVTTREGDDHYVQRFGPQLDPGPRLLVYRNRLTPGLRVTDNGSWNCDAGTWTYQPYEDDPTTVTVQAPASKQGSCLGNVIGNDLAVVSEDGKQLLLYPEGSTDPITVPLPQPMRSCGSLRGPARDKTATSCTPVDGRDDVVLGIDIKNRTARPLLVLNVDDRPIECNMLSPADLALAACKVEVRAGERTVLLQIGNDKVTPYLLDADGPVDLSIAGDMLVGRKSMWKAPGS